MTESEISNSILNDTEPLSYDKMTKKMLSDSPKLTIGLINGLMGENFSLDTPVTWLDKETTDGERSVIADFYPKIGDRLFCIEVENSDDTGMALRVFDYAAAAAMRHGKTSERNEVTIEFPKPCVVFLRSTANTPLQYSFTIKCFDGQKVTMKIPVIRLSDLTPKEIAERKLFPIGQFLPHSYEPLNSRKDAEKLFEIVQSLLGELRNAVNNGEVPRHLAMLMNENIKTCFDNAVKRSKVKGDVGVVVNIDGVLPWYNYKELFQRAESEGEAKGEAKGRAEGEAKGKMEIAVKMFIKQKANMRPDETMDMLKDLGVPDDIIQDAWEQVKDQY